MTGDPRPAREWPIPWMDKGSGHKDTAFTWAMGALILQRIADGETMKAITADPRMPAYCTVYRWMQVVPEFGDLVAEVRAALAANRLAEPDDAKTLSNAAPIEFGSLLGELFRSQFVERCGATDAVPRRPVTVPTFRRNDMRITTLAICGLAAMTLAACQQKQEEAAPAADAAATAAQDAAASASQAAADAAAAAGAAADTTAAAATDAAGAAADAANTAADKANAAAADAKAAVTEPAPK